MFQVIKILQVVFRVLQVLLYSQILHLHFTQPQSPGQHVLDAALQHHPEWIWLGLVPLHHDPAELGRVEDGHLGAVQVLATPVCLTSLLPWTPGSWMTPSRAGLLPPSSPQAPATSPRLPVKYRRNCRRTWTTGVQDETCFFFKVCAHLKAPEGLIVGESMCLPAGGP